MKISDCTQGNRTAVLFSKKEIAAMIRANCHNFNQNLPLQSCALRLLCSLTPIA